MPLSITTPDGGSASVGIPSEGQTMRLAIGTGMVDAALVAKDFYNAVNLNPEYVADFFESYYRVNKVPSTLSGALNFARTGTATYTDSTGTLQTAATGVARTDHHIWDGSAWVNQGLLIESDAATNLLTYSEQFDNAAWLKQGFGTGSPVVVTANHAVAPDGTATADRVQFDKGVGSTSSDISRITGPTMSLSGSNAWSVWLKLTSGSTPRSLELSISAIGKTTVVVTDVWQRFDMRATLSAGSYNVRLDLVGNVSADQTADLLVWGAQLEANSIPTSYIKTEATTATRNAETLTASAADLPYNLTAVSIQMEGTMSYADNNSVTEVLLLDWSADASNEIDVRVDTGSSGGSGAIVFRQRESGTVDVSLSPSNTYTPGINVPFNIASRHGSTFINGAVDGTALTANTTPTALPDLTATDLDIAPNFNGTIKLLRIWGSDIGDTGIAQASD